MFITHVWVKVAFNGRALNVLVNMEAMISFRQSCNLSADFENTTFLLNECNVSSDSVFIFRNKTCHSSCSEIKAKKKLLRNLRSAKKDAFPCYVVERALATEK